MCIKIKVICRKDRVYSNNTAPLFLRFTKNKQVKYQSLGISIPLESWDFENSELINNYPLFRKHNRIIEDKVLEYEKSIQRMEVLEIEITMHNLLGKSVQKHPYTVSEYFNKCIEKLDALGKVGTASKYIYCKSLFNQYCSPKTRFEEIDIKFLQGLELFLRNRGNNGNSIATKFSVLKAVYNKALTDGIFIARNNPFQKFKVGSLWTPTRKRAISKEDILKFIGVEVPKGAANSYKRISKDIFLFSYYTAGMNFKDIAMLRYRDIINDRIYYARRKTKKEMSCHLIAPAKEIIASYSQREHTDEDFIFPVLDRYIHITEQQIYNRIHKSLVKVNRELKELGKAAGIKMPLSTYVARHTFATVLKRSGVNIAIISEALGHSDISTTQIYLDSFEDSQIDEAMKHLM